MTTPHTSESTPTSNPAKLTETGAWGTKINRRPSRLIKTAFISVRLKLILQPRRIDMTCDTCRSAAIVECQFGPNLEQTARLCSPCAANLWQRIEPLVQAGYSAWVNRGLDNPTAEA